tara:strand:- start:158 stop:601 length:444 start_codon:yes stop_codon:yes gene_type:complete
MPTRAFSIEDGNLGAKTIISSQNRTFSDIDLTFAKKASGDVFKKNSAAAVKQAVKNLLLTNFSEKPFLERFGGDLNALLFRLSTEVDDANLEDKIKRSLELFEPRAKVLNINSIISADNHEVKVTVTFQVITTQEVVDVDVSLTRLR